MLDRAGPPRPHQICAVIVTYNIGAAIDRCFSAIHNQVGHVLIVDNCSDEATRLELSSLAGPRVTLILNPHNEGIAHAYNRAIEWIRSAGFQWVLLLDHDSEATAGMVQELIETYILLWQQGTRNIGIVGTNLFELSTQRYLLAGSHGDKTSFVEDDSVTSSGSLISLSVFDSGLRFNEDLFIYYVDTDFCRRLKRAGYRTFISSAAVLLHREGDRRVHKFLWRTATYNHYSKEARYYLMRNAIYLLRKGTLDRNDLRWILRRYWNDHLKILVFDERRFTVLWHSLRGLLDGLRGKLGPMNSPERA